MNSICIVGGGTAGYITALILKRRFPNIKITLIKSDKIGIIGVGEGSTPHWDDFLKFVDISPTDMVKHCGATCKTSIYFKGWAPKDYNHVVSHPILDEVLQLKVRLLHKFYEGQDPLYVGPREHLQKQIDPNLSKPFHQYHFDTFKLNNYLHKVAAMMGVKVIDDEITDVVFNDLGNVKSVSGKQQHFADFYVDASGFKKVIFSDLDCKWVDVNKWLTLDKAVVYRTELQEIPNVWTESQAMNYGWKFKIPVQDKQGNGYIFDSNYCSDAEAMEEVCKVDASQKFNWRTIPFRPGYLNKCWIKNCFATGLTGSFFEPLEATSIAISIQQAFMLANNLINYNKQTSDRVNDQFIKLVENSRDFIILHYLTKKTNNDFWKAQSQMALPDSLATKLDLFEQRLPVSDDFSGDGDYALWKDQHYSIVMYGLGMFDPKMIKKHYESLPDVVKKHLKELEVANIDYFKKTTYINHDEWLNQVREGRRVIK